MKQSFEKILFVGPNFRRRRGGIASVLKKYHEYLGGEHINFKTTAPYQSPVLNFLLLPFQLMGILFYLLRFRRISIVHIHGSSGGSFFRKYFVFLIAKKLLNRTVVYHMHSGRFDRFYRKSPKILKARIRKMVEASDGLITLSEQSRNIFQKLFRQPRVFVLNNIISERKLHKKETPHYPITYLFLGKIDDNKGIFDVLKALRENFKEFQGKTQVLIGGIGEVDKLQKLIEEYNIQELVQYMGWVEGEMKEQLFLRSQVILLPSHSEGLPISLLEAMSFGMPLMASHVGGISNILTHGENGFVVEPSNIESISNGIRYYINQPEKINRHGRESFNRAADYFPERVFQDLLNIYEEIG